MKQRIQKVLSAAGVDSRRHIEQMVLEGRISVNGEVMDRLPILVDPAKDKITVDGQSIKLKRDATAPMVYVLLNKPKHIYVTNVSQGEQKRAIDLLPPDFPRLFPVGRLEHDSRGLLILTNDGDLTNRLTHPKYQVPKTFILTVDGELSAEAERQMREGVWLSDSRSGKGFKARVDQMKILTKSAQKTTVELTIRDGKNRELRRIMVKIGYKVRDLIRTRFGPLTIDGVGTGKWRLLSPGEIKKLQRAGETEYTPAPPPPKETKRVEVKREEPADGKPKRNPNQLRLS